MSEKKKKTAKKTGIEELKELLEVLTQNGVYLYCDGTLTIHVRDRRELACAAGMAPLKEVSNA